MYETKIIKVKRANVVLDVPEYQKQEYLAQGYDVIGDDGKIVERTIPIDPNALRKAYLEQTKLIEELKSKTADTEGVPQEDYDNLLNEYNAVQDENEALKARIEELEEAVSKKKSAKK